MINLNKNSDNVCKKKRFITHVKAYYCTIILDYMCKNEWNF
jgi:hypothetical protein